MSLCSLQTVIKQACMSYISRGKLGYVCRQGFSITSGTILFHFLCCSTLTHSQILKATEQYQSCQSTNILKGLLPDVYMHMDSNQSMSLSVSQFSWVTPAPYTIQYTLSYTELPCISLYMPTGIINNSEILNLL